MHTVIKEDINELLANTADLSTRLKDKRFLVTGATGMIGQYLTHYLTEVTRSNGGSGHVTAHVRNQTKAEAMFSDHVNSGNFDLFVSDIEDIDQFAGNVDYIIHAASPTQPQDFLERPVDIIKANVFATDSLLTTAKQQSAKLCLLSTLEIYGEIQASSYPVYATEDQYGALDSIDLRSAYPESKRLAENLCVAHQQQYGTESVIVRLSPTISPIIDPTDNRVYAQFINFVANKQDITMFSDAFDKKRTYTYIADAIIGILVALIEPSKDEKVPTYNLANTDNVTSIGELAEAIIKVGGNQVQLHVNEREDTSNTSTSTGLILLDSQKLRAAGWKPVYTLEKSITQTFKYVSSTLN